MLDGNPGRLVASPSVMRETQDDLAMSPKRDAQIRALWVVLAVGLCLLAAAAVSGGEPGSTATRTDRFQAVLAPGSTVRVDNVNGDVVAARGAAFSAVVTTSVTAPDKPRADDFLSRTHVEQSTSGTEYALETVWPGFEGMRARGRHRAPACRNCRIVSRYELTLPPGTSAKLQTVNGDVQVREVDGNIVIQSVNGNVQATGVQRSLDAQAVNGRVEAVATQLPDSAAWRLQTVNGTIVATLPKSAKFDWSASTLGGSIASSFPLPPAREDAPVAAPAPPGQPRSSARVIVSREENDELIDVGELAREVEESLREAERDVHQETRGHRTVRISLPQHHYEAKVGGGGPAVRSSTLNGNITLLAAGTSEKEALPLVSSRRAITVTVPRIEVAAPEVVVRVPPVHAPPVRVDAVPPPVDEPDEPEEAPEEGEIVRGDVSGDFFSSSNVSYRLGHVSGRVKILTHAGEIKVASAGHGAEIKTYGGDIHIGPVQGDLKAQTYAGDVRVGPVVGTVAVDTSGGDIRIDRIGGAVTAKTGGGDIVLSGVAGSVNAETGGGEVRIVVLSRQIKGGITIRNEGGDVLLTLPSDVQADVDLQVEEPGTDDTMIRSEFPGVSVTRGSEAQTATGSLNGGGSRVLVRTTSGSIRLRKAPPAATP